MLFDNKNRIKNRICYGNNAMRKKFNIKMINNSMKISINYLQMFISNFYF